MFRMLAIAAACFALASGAGAAEYKWTGDGFVEVSAVAPTAADETVLTEREMLASTPRRSVTKTTTTTVSSVPAMAAPMSACGTMSSRTTTVTTERRSAPIRRMFGFRLRGGC